MSVCITVISGELCRMRCCRYGIRSGERHQSEMHHHFLVGLTTIASALFPNRELAPHNRTAIHHSESLNIIDSMDITAFVVAQRNKALLVGDYGTYRKQLSRRLLVVRKKLNYVSSSSKGRKYSAKPLITAEDIAKNHECVDSNLLSNSGVC